MAGIKHPGERTDTGVVIASAYDDPDDTEATYLVLLPEPPYYAVETRLIETGELLVSHGVEWNIVPAAEKYTVSGCWS